MRLGSEIAFNQTVTPCRSHPIKNYRFGAGLVKIAGCCCITINLTLPCWRNRNPVSFVALLDANSLIRQGCRIIEAMGEEHDSIHLETITGLNGMTPNKIKQ